MDQQNISQKQTFGCAHCISTFKNRGNLTLHLKGVHLVDPLKKHQYLKCDFCDAYYKLKKRLEKHMALNHKETIIASEPHKCGCGESFPSMFACIKHQRISNCALKKKPANKTCVNIYKKSLKSVRKCVTCDKTFKSLFNLNRHLEIHKGPLHECGECNRTYKTKASLNRHLKTHKGAGSYECSICSKLFHQKITLQTHLKAVHLGIRNFQCSHCGAKFTQKVYLIKHLKSIHTADPVKQMQSHKCKFCDSYYACKIHLSNHMNTLHKNVAEENPKCTTQPKTVKNINNLDTSESKQQLNYDFLAPTSIQVPDIQTVEMVMINGKKCFKCHKCDCISSKYSNIERHMIRHSDVKPFKCSLCDLRFKLKSTLREHLKSIHDIKCKINDNRILWREIKNLSSDIFTMINNKEKKRLHIKNTIRTEDNNIRSKQNFFLNEGQHGFKTDDNIFGLSMPSVDDDSVSHKNIIIAEQPKKIQIGHELVSVLSVHNPSTKTVDSIDVNSLNQVNSFSSIASTVNIKHNTDTATPLSQDAVLGQASDFIVGRVKSSFTGVQMPNRVFNKENPKAAHPLENINNKYLCRIEDINESSEPNDISLFNILSNGIDSECYDIIEEHQNAKKNSTNNFMDTSADLLNISDKSKDHDMVKMSSLKCGLEENHSCVANSHQLRKASIELTQTETISLHSTNRGQSRDFDCSVSSLDVSFDINGVSFQSSCDDISLSDIFMDVQHCNCKSIKCQNSVNTLSSRIGESKLAYSNHCSGDLLDQTCVAKENMESGMNSLERFSSNPHNQPHYFNDKTEKITKENMTITNPLPLDINIVGSSSLSDEDIHALENRNPKLASFVNSQCNLYNLAAANTAPTTTTVNKNDLVPSININNVDMFREDTSMDGIITYESSVNTQLNLDISSICTNGNVTKAYSMTPIDMNTSLSEVNINSSETSDQVMNPLQSIENPATDIFDLLLDFNDEITTTTGQTVPLSNTNDIAHTMHNKIDIIPAKIKERTHLKVSGPDVDTGNLDFKLNETQDINISFNVLDNSQVCSNYDSEANMIWKLNEMNKKKITGDEGSTNENVFHEDLNIPEIGKEVANPMSITKLHQSMEGTGSDGIENIFTETLNLLNIAQNIKESVTISLQEAIYTEDNSPMNNYQLQLSLNPNLIHVPDYKHDDNSSRKQTIGCSVGTTVNESECSNVQNNVVFKDPEEMLRTIQKCIPTNIDHPHKCKTCLASFRKLSDLLQHEMIHSSRDKLLCNLCGSVFSSKSAITLHLKYHDPARMLCWICGKLLKEISFRQHPCFAVHKMLSCPFCEEKFKSRPARLKHLYVTHTVHNTPKNREKKTKQYIYKCKECRIDFTLRSKLRDHQSVVHNEKGEFVCECGKTYWNQNELLRHQKKHLKSKGFHVIKK